MTENITQIELGAPIQESVYSNLEHRQTVLYEQLDVQDPVTKPELLAITSRCRIIGAGILLLLLATQVTTGILVAMNMTKWKDIESESRVRESNNDSNDRINEDIIDLMMARINSSLQDIALRTDSNERINEDIIDLMMARINSSLQDIALRTDNVEKEDKDILDTIVARINSLQDIVLRKDRGPFHCPNTWIYFNGSCYLFGEGKSTFAEAEQYCRQQNSQLVKIETREENSFLKHMNAKYTNIAHWIGLTDIDTENVWKWLDGSVPRFTNWAEGEPNQHTQANCASLYLPFNSDWTDEPCDRLYPPICEIM